MCAGPSWEEQTAWAGHGPVPSAPTHSTLSAAGKVPRRFPRHAERGQACTTQASVILEGTFCCVSLETFSKGFPCSMSLAVPAAITRAGDPKHLSQVQALGQQPLCTAAAGPRMGSRSRGTAVLGLRTPETNPATLHSIPDHAPLSCRVSDLVFRKPGSEAVPRAGWKGARGAIQGRLTVGQACSPALLGAGLV